MNRAINGACLATGEESPGIAVERSRCRDDLQCNDEEEGLQCCDFVGLHLKNEFICFKGSEASFFSHMQSPEL